MSERYDKTEHPAPEPVRAYRVWAIYADYDAMAPNTEDLILVSTKELAEAVCAILNEDPRAWGSLAFVDGFEHCKSFRAYETLAEGSDEVRRSVAEVFGEIGEEEEEED